MYSKFAKRENEFYVWLEIFLELKPERTFHCPLVD